MYGNHHHLQGAVMSQPVWDIPAFCNIPGGGGISQKVVRYSRGGWNVQYSMNPGAPGYLPFIRPFIGRQRRWDGGVQA